MFARNTRNLPLRARTCLLIWGLSKPLGVPIACLSICMNQSNSHLFQNQRHQKQTANNQLCPSTVEALANFPLNFLVKKVISIAKYGLQPLRNPSVHGFKAKKNLLNLIFFFHLMINHYNATGTTALNLCLK